VGSNPTAVSDMPGTSLVFNFEKKMVFSAVNMSHGGKEPSSNFQAVTPRPKRASEKVVYVGHNWHSYEKSGYACYEHGNFAVLHVLIFFRCGATASGCACNVILLEDLCRVHVHIPVIQKDIA
jgi:hypothetical protein